MNKRVVITGVGPVSSVGIGKQAYLSAIQTGRNNFKRATQYDCTVLDGLTSGPIENFSILEYLPSRLRKTAKLMSRDIQLAVASSVLAMNDAGFNIEGNENRNCWGSISGAGIISVEHGDLAIAFQDCIDSGLVSLTRWGERSMNLLPPLMVLKYLPNMLGSHISIIHQLKGISNTITCGEPSGHMAIGEAYNAIRRGSCDLALCGGAESKVNPTDLVYEHVRGRLATGGNAKPDQVTESDFKESSGTVPAEGAGYLVLEALEHAIQRQAPILAEIKGFSIRQSITENESSDMASTHGMARAIKSAMRAAKLTAEDIDIIIPNAVGVHKEDEIERQAIRYLFESTSGKPILNIRNLVGNCYAGNSLDVIAAALVASGVFPLSHLPFETSSRVSSGTDRSDARNVLAVSCNTDGQNAALIVSRFG